MGRERASWAPAPPPSPPQPLAAQAAAGLVTAGREVLAEGHVTGRTQPLRGDLRAGSGLMMNKQTGELREQDAPRGRVAGEGPRHWGAAPLPLTCATHRDCILLPPTSPALCGNGTQLMA